jgi:hypothetical protein
MSNDFSTLLEQIDASVDSASALIPQIPADGGGNGNGNGSNTPHVPHGPGLLQLMQQFIAAATALSRALESAIDDD